VGCEINASGIGVEGSGFGAKCARLIGAKCARLIGAKCARLIGAKCARLIGAKCARLRVFGLGFTLAEHQTKHK
jgi:hypothetical protein